MPAIMNKMRENTHIILIILVLAFIGTIIFDWGMNYLGNQSQGMPHGGVIGEVNGNEITYDMFFRQIQQEYTNIRERTGQEPTEQQMNQLRQNVWERMVNEILVDEQIREKNIAVTDQEILTILQTDPPAFLRQNPAFQTDEQFDPQKYQEALQNPEIDWSMVESLVRSTQPSVKLQNRILSTIRVTQQEAMQEFYRQNTVGKIEYIVQDINYFENAEIEIPDGQIQNYYNEHKEDFQRPQRRKVQYALFSTQATSQDTQRVYERAENIIEEAKQGEDFAELARNHSQDNSAEQGGDLGYFAPGDMIKEFEEAAMNAKTGEIVGPVKTRFGLHIIKVIDKKMRRRGAQVDSIRASHILLHFEPSTQTTDDARYRANYFLESAKQDGWDQAALTDSVQVQETDFFTRSGFIPGIGMNEELTRFAFSRPVGEVGGTFEDPRGYYVVKIQAKEDEHIPPLDDVRAQIEDILRNERLRQMAFERVSGIYQSILQGKSFEEAAQEAGLTVRTTGEFGPGDYLDGVGREPKVTGKILALKQGDVSEPIETGRGCYLIKVIEKKEPQEADFESKQSEIFQNLIAEKQQLMIYAWMSKLRDKAEIKDYRDEFFSL